MAQPDALTYTLGGGWQLLAAGIAAGKDGGIAANVVLQNGRPVHVARIALTDPDACAAYAAAVTGPERPGPAAIGQG
ncbi:MAG: hypothetical protein M3Q65_17880, partial [Chloroflexota bacterium]|nr:hypothetical protein [Chloroflexota bacterium]